MQDFSRLLDRLASSGLDFVIVGGYAAVTYGSSMVTRDLDICTDLSNETIEKLRRILADWNPRHRMTPDKLPFLEFPLSGPVHNLYLQTDVGVIDILSSILGVGDFPRLRQSAEDIQIGDHVFHIIALDDLISSKEALGREKDLLAAKELRAIAVKQKKRDRS